MAAYPDFAIAKLPDAYARLDFVLIDPAQAVMKFGDIRKLGRKVTIPHHSSDMAEGTLRALLRKAGISVNDFLKA
jgi:hypothetical protein